MSGNVYTPNVGLPKFGQRTNTRPRMVCANGIQQYLSGGRIGNGLKSRDVFNVGIDAGELGAERDLEPGLLIGLLSADGFYANSFFGVTVAAIVATATSTTVTARQATELVRRVGSSGNMTLTGPPTTNGTVAQETIAYSAVNTSTGVITHTATVAAFVAGSLLGAADGSQVPTNFIPDEWGELVPPDSSNFPIPRLAFQAMIVESQLVPWPANAPLQQWIKDQLVSSRQKNLFTFTDRF